MSDNTDSKASPMHHVSLYKDIWFLSMTYQVFHRCCDCGVDEHIP